MKNELNVLIMDGEEVVRWFKPQTEVEKHLYSIIKSYTENSEVESLEYELYELRGEVDRLRDENNGFEYDLNDVKSQLKYALREIDEKDKTISDLNAELKGLTK